MAGGYSSQPDGLDYVKAEIEAIKRRLDNMSGSAPATDLVIVGVDDSRMRLNNGRIWLWDDYAQWPDTPGLIMTDPGVGKNYLRMFPPFSDGTGLENSVTVRGRRPGESGRVWLYSDGAIDLVVQLEDGTPTGTARLRAAQTIIGQSASDSTMVLGRQVTLSTSNEDFQIYGLPTTTESGNLRIQVDEGVPRLYYGNASNEELKDDLEPLTVTPADVLAIEVVQWSEGDRTVIGVTAEQVGSIESVAPLLIRPRYPEGESVEYDRVPILHHVVLRDHEDRIAELEAENAELKSKLDKALARLDALEAA